MKTEQLASIFDGVAATKLEDGDVVIVRVNRPISMEQQEKLHAHLSERLGTDRVLILDPGVEVSVLKATPQAVAVHDTPISRHRPLSG